MIPFVLVADGCIKRDKTILFGKGDVGGVVMVNADWFTDELKVFVGWRLFPITFTNEELAAGTN